MAQFDGLSKAKAEAIIGASVVSATINPSGHLIFTRNNGSTFDAGDFTAIVQSSFTQQIDAALLTAVPAAVAGQYVVKNAATGTLSLTEFNKDNIVNAFIRVNAVGNVAFAAGDLPANCRPGTKFTLLFKQDNPNGATQVDPGQDKAWTGGRNLVVAGLKTNAAPPYMQPGGYTIYEFMWDGMYWHSKIYLTQLSP